MKSMLGIIFSVGTCKVWFNHKVNMKGTSVYSIESIL